MIPQVRDSGAPFVFVTNQGWLSESDRAALLSEQLSMEIPKEQVVLAHSALAEAAPAIDPGLVLVTGRCRTDAAEIVRGYGFSNVRTVAEYARAHPHLHPLKHDPGTGGGMNGGGGENENEDDKNDKNDDDKNGDEPPSWASEPVRAIFIVETPEDWHEDLQILLDVLRSDGVPGRRASMTLPAEGGGEGRQKLKKRQPVQLFVCNFDFYFAAANAPPRFGPGAFLAALEALHAAADAAAGITPHVPLEIVRHGKPHPPAYEIAVRKLERLIASKKQQEGSDSPVSVSLKHVYALGDNPASDVRGANAAGGPWRSVLVRTGVWKGTKRKEGGSSSVYERAENDERDPAHFVCEDAAEAIDMILRSNGC